ncbi:MAG TPA: hypothetical protein DCQ37_04170, partial [Desulfobacteraceae bacterium]|nr:hypothetical protein [Desulfobacteraceae bacterium]
PRSGEGSYCGMFNFSPPALSGKGDGGLGRMRKVSYDNTAVSQKVQAYKKKSPSDKKIFS